MQSLALCAIVSYSYLLRTSDDPHPKASIIHQRHRFGITARALKVRHHMDKNHSILQRIMKPQPSVSESMLIFTTNG